MWITWDDFLLILEGMHEWLNENMNGWIGMKRLYTENTMMGSESISRGYLLLFPPCAGWCHRPGIHLMVRLMLNFLLFSHILFWIESTYSLWGIGSVKGEEFLDQAAGNSCFANAFLGQRRFGLWIDPILNDVFYCFQLQKIGWSDGEKEGNKLAVLALQVKERLHHQIE